jgi:hypothetical protein
VPPLALISPFHLKMILEADGFTVVYEDDVNWWLARGLRDIPLNIPRETASEDGCVPMEVMEDVLFNAKIDHFRYFALREMVFGKGKGFN